MKCPHCQKELLENDDAGSCPSCGRDLLPPAESNPSESPAQDKSIYWVIFWLTFFGAPILCLLAVSARAGGGILSLPVLGAIIAGFSLAKVYARTPAAFIASGILFVLGVLVIYVGIIFIGCLVVLGHGGGM